MKYIIPTYLLLLLSGFTIAQEDRASPDLLSNEVVIHDMSVSSIAGVRYGAVAWADYDNDGDQDVMITGSHNRENSQSISKLYQYQDSVFVEVLSGTFEGVSFGSVTWVDYDNDGDQDVMITGQSSNYQHTAKLYENQNNNFSEVEKGVFKGVYDSSVAWADYDNDGDQDVIITGKDENFETSTRLYENREQKFSLVLPDVFTNVWRGSVAWADYDNDGDQDLLITGYEAFKRINTKGYEVVDHRPSARLYQNQATSFIEVYVDTFEGVAEGSIAWADYDNDGRSDIMITGQNNQNEPITKLYRNGSTGFAEVLKSSFDGVYRSAIGWADYDNDGDQDILITGQNADSKTTAKLYENKLTAFEETFAGKFENVYYGAIAWADYDNDGDQDILITGEGNYVGTTAKLYNNTGTDFRETYTVTFDRSLNDVIVWADYDSDGDQDIMFAGSNKVILYQNQDIGFVEVHSNVFEGIDHGDIDWVDYDNDGDQDVMIAGMRGPNDFITKLYQNQNNTFTEVHAGTFEGVSYCDIDWVDYDNDGDQDVMISGRNSNYKVITKLYQNTSTNFVVVHSGTFEATYYGSTAWVDYDNDGDQDVIIAGYNSKHIAVTKLYQNHGSAFTEVFAGNFEGLSGSTAWADYDSDGDMDIAIAGFNKDRHHKTKLYRNDGVDFTEVYSGVFEPVNLEDLAWVDYDNDGDQDLSLIGQNASSQPVTRLYKNQGDGFVAAEIGKLADVYAGSIAWADYNSDGYQDVVVSGLSNRKYGNSNAVTKLYSLKVNEKNAFYPLDKSTGVVTNTDLRVTFNEAIKANSGGLYIKQYSNDSIVSYVNITSDQVSIDGPTALIDSVNNLEGYTKYYVSVDSGAISDLSGNAFAGFAYKDKWSFTTGRAIVPKVDESDSLQQPIDTLYNLMLEVVADSETPLPLSATLYKQTNDRWQAVKVKNGLGESTLLFDQLSEGIYTVGVRPIETTFLPSYLGNQLLLSDAKTLTLHQDTLQRITLLLIPDKQADKIATVSGVLLESTEINNGRIAVNNAKHTGDGLTNIPVYLLHSLTHDVIAYTITGQQGSFSFADVPTGDYFFAADYKGIPNSKTENLITVKYSAKDIKITVLVGKDVRVTKVETEEYVTAIDEHIISLEVQCFPNPVTDELAVVLPTTWMNGTIEVRNLLGKLLENRKITNSNIKLDFSRFDRGVYVIHLYNDNLQQTFKIYKLH